MTLQISRKQILCEGDIYKISSEYIVTNFLPYDDFFTLKLNTMYLLTWYSTIYDLTILMMTVILNIFFGKLIFFSSSKPFAFFSVFPTLLVLGLDDFSVGKLESLDRNI